MQPICGIEKLKVTYTSKKDDISVFPNNFIPLVFINKNYFEAYFLRKVDSFIKGSLQNGKNPDQPSPSREELNHRICSYQIGQGKRSRLIFVYASLAFLDGLESTLMLTAYLGLDEELLGKNSLDKKSKKISYKMHDPNNEDHHNYYKKLKPIFDDLLTRPLITHYVFALILKAELPNITTINKDLDKYAKFIENLWHFTLEVVVGLEELAKNIVQHSTTGCGVITARIHTKKEENNLFKTYADLLLAMEDGLKSVLNINVIDLGRNGVVDNLSQYTRSHAENASEKLKALLKQDLDVLNGEDFSVKNLVDPKENKKQTLHQQAKRAIAHFGLLVLSRLIIDTGGGIYVATNTKKCKETDRDQAWVNIIVPQSTPLHMQ